MRYDKNRLATILEHPENLNNQELLIALETLLKTYKDRVQTERTIPVSIFSSKKIGILEATVKFLKENMELSYHEIAQLLNRDERTIWVSYSKAAHKHKEKFSPKDDSLFIPVSIFTDRNLGPLEAVTIYLKMNNNLSFNEMATMLKRDYQTIWLSYQNGRRGNT